MFLGVHEFHCFKFGASNIHIKVPALLKLNAVSGLALRVEKHAY